MITNLKLMRQEKIAFLAGSGKKQMTGQYEQEKLMCTRRDPAGSEDGNIISDNDDIITFGKH